MSINEALDALEAKTPKLEPIKIKEFSFKKAPFFGPTQNPKYSVVCNEQIGGTDYSLALIHKS